jgi:hypothetical protein
VMDEKEFFKQRRNRAIAAILGYKDRELDQFLPPDISNRFRKEILFQINELSDLALDLIGSAGVNEVFLDKIDEIYAAVVQE